MSITKKVKKEIPKAANKTPFETRDMSGSLFVNERKTTDKHPDLNGKCKISDTEFYISGWEKTSDGGKEYISLAFTLVEKE